MENLVAHMENDLQFVQEHLINLQDNGINTPSGRKSIEALRGLLYDHFNYEREFLFPYLKDQQSGQVREVLNSYLVDYEKSISRFRSFFNKYEKKGFYDDYLFYTDLYNFNQLINERFECQQKNLFRLLEKLDIQVAV
jgi:hypothetical protein